MKTLRDLLQSWMDKWRSLDQRVKTALQWLGRLLMGAAFVYIIWLLVRDGQALFEIDWLPFLPATVGVMILYMLSLGLQYFAWTRLLSFQRKAGWLDFAIFARIVVMKRLPGGVWHWVGRASLYNTSTQVPTRTVMIANFLEIILIVLVSTSFLLPGLADFPPLLGWLLSLLAMAAAVVISVIWVRDQAGAKLGWRHDLGQALLWLGSYAGCLLLGAWILLLYGQAGGAASLTFSLALNAWAIAAAISYLIVFVPAGLGIRELTFVMVLGPYLPATTGLVIGVLIRLAFTLADVIWGLAGWGFGEWMHRRGLAREKQNSLSEDRE
ncbi:MAG TPA: hypothetical protein PKW33_18005 [Anaerolineaceae bacterium]|nr:hypothetical protein [Anaerolineaceae bacterium]HPN53495.1 hypothetical protein [Anaerolineaceae bacterium]